jgi:hypothetical protein
MTSFAGLSLNREEKHKYENSKAIISRLVLICVIHRNRFKKGFQEQENWILRPRSDRKTGARRNEANCCDSIGFD